MGLEKFLKKTKTVTRRTSFSDTTLTRSNEQLLKELKNHSKEVLLDKLKKFTDKHDAAHIDRRILSNELGKYSDMMSPMDLKKFKEFLDRDYPIIHNPIYSIKYAPTGVGIKAEIMCPCGKIEDITNYEHW